MCETAEATGELGNFMWFCCNLAQALLGLGRDDEAEQWLERGRETAPSEEPHPQMLWRQVRGKVLARRGELQEGERLAREAVALAEPSDNLRLRSMGLEDLVHILLAAGRPRDAIPAVEELVRLRERKGEPVAAAKARSLLGQLRATAIA